MSDEPLDLDALEKLYTELDIGGLHVEEYPWLDNADILIDGYQGNITIENATIEQARKLASLLKAIPRLLELARWYQREHYPDWFDSKE